MAATVLLALALPSAGCGKGRPRSSGADAAPAPETAPAVAAPDAGVPPPTGSRPPGEIVDAVRHRVLDEALSARGRKCPRPVLRGEPLPGDGVETIADALEGRGVFAACVAAAEAAWPDFSRGFDLLAGLLTPRLDVGVSPRRLGPATRRSGAYRDGTCTRWRSAARNRARVHHVASDFVTAHHVPMVESSASPGQSELPSSPARGHVCPWWIGWLLLLPLRRLFESPEKLLGPHVRPGMTVLEPGCAMGFFSLPLARMVGPQGRVLCVDLQENMIRRLRRRARSRTD